MAMQLAGRSHQIAPRLLKPSQMPPSEDLRYAYRVQWSDAVSGTVWEYQLSFYPETGEVEMVRHKVCKSWKALTAIPHCSHIESLRALMYAAALVIRAHFGKNADCQGGL